jgi:site-specific recombinase XerD
MGGDALSRKDIGSSATVGVGMKTALTDQIDDFFADQTRKMKRGDLSPATISQRRYALSIFSGWASEAGVTDAADVTVKRMEEFEDWLRARTHHATGKPLTRVTINSYLRAIKPFLASAKAPMTEYRLPKKPGRRQLEVLSRSELDSLEQAADDERDRLIVRLMGDVGLRVNEVLGLRPGDLKDQSRAVNVIGKGDKERTVPLTPAVFKRLRHYAEHGGPKNASYIFMSRRKRGGKSERLTRSGIDQLVRNLAVSAGIDRRVWPHLLRHSAITHLLRKNVNPVAVMRLVGHTNLSQITGTYSHLVTDDLSVALIEALR